MRDSDAFHSSFHVSDKVCKNAGGLKLSAGKMLISGGACHATDLVEHTELVANRIGTVIVSTKF